MVEPLIAWLVGASLVSLLGSLAWAAWRSRRPRSGKAQEAGAFCVWCLYRRGELCSHPGSPVYPGPCSPVCGGAVRCELRQERQRW